MHYIISDNDPNIIETKSIQAVRNGINNKLKSGVIVKPILESVTAFNNRVIFKHNTDPVHLSLHLKSVANTNKLVDNLVTRNRFDSVANKILQHKHSNKDMNISDINLFLELMVEDTLTVINPDNIRKKTGSMFRNIYCTN